MKKKRKIFHDYLKNESGLAQLLRIGQSIRNTWVKPGLGYLQTVLHYPSSRDSIHVFAVMGNQDIGHPIEFLLKFLRNSRIRTH